MHLIRQILKLPAAVHHLTERVHALESEKLALQVERTTLKSFLMASEARMRAMLSRARKAAQEEDEHVSGDFAMLQREKKLDEALRIRRQR